MSDKTTIQWSDSTINPIMGCGGCELFPPPGEIFADINRAAARTGVTIDSKAIFKVLVDDCFAGIQNPGPEFKRVVNTTNIWHLRKRFAEKVRRDHGTAARDAVELVIRRAITCYAAKLHLNKGVSIVNPTRHPHKGYAPIFEKVTQFKGRVAKAAKLKDLLGSADPVRPWKDALPRMLFVSDMGDALSTKGDFEFLKSDMMPAIRSERGSKHLWLWLSKRPERMVEFADEIGGFPANVCAMTTITSAGQEQLNRIDHLRRVKAPCRGLSIEPLWERIPAATLDLTGIDWVIVGGESGSGATTRPFAVEWAEELRDHCKKQGVAFFLKQLGRNPTRNGRLFRLRDKHGGDWKEWKESLRVREFPKHFHLFRAEERRETDQPIPPRPGPKVGEKSTGRSA
ncbi:MAG: DUF5131 family protein [Verrucomicrobiota bacterium]|jgi:protein gp37